MNLVQVPVVSGGQTSLANMQTVTVNSNGQISTSPTNYANGAGVNSNYGGASTGQVVNGATAGQQQQQQGQVQNGVQNQLSAYAASLFTMR